MYQRHGIKSALSSGIGQWKRSGDEFVNLRFRPKNDLERNQLWSPDLRADTAIVLQGPIIHENDFTYQTALRYRINFPNAPIIISTWESEEIPQIERYKILDVIVFLQPKPKYAGISNSNLQMVSSANGIKLASTLNVSHVIKTRTDQRIYSERLLGLLHAAINMFPLTCNSVVQSQRILGLSLNTFKYRLYGLSDMFLFGSIRDMSLYWNGILDQRKESDFKAENSIRGYSQQQVCEVRYCSDFLTNSGRELKWTLEDSWAAFASQFIILDAGSLDLFWPKYSNQEERWRSYDGNPRFQEIDFAFWLMIQSEAIAPDESILDIPYDNL